MYYENFSTNLDSVDGSYSGISGNSEEISSDYSENEIVSDESGREEKEEESSEIDSQTESGDTEETSGTGVTETSSELRESNEVITHIDNTLNSFFGLFVIVLVLIGIGLILKYIWGLLNK